MVKKWIFTTVIGAALVVILGAFAYYRPTINRADPVVRSPLAGVSGTPTTQEGQSAADYRAQCAKALATQRDYLAKEKLSATETFAKYPATAKLSGTPADLDVTSNRVAAEFRTSIRREMARVGVNFAGNYSIVDVGMTGWGPNYYIIDRRSGHAYLFPYFAIDLSFKKDSNLIIMNPKEKIAELTHPDPADPLAGCYNLMQQQSTDLRPFYFLWKDNQLTLIGPRGMTPPANAFWKDFFGPPAAKTLTPEVALTISSLEWPCQPNGMEGQYRSCTVSVSGSGDKWLSAVTYDGLYDDSAKALRVQTVITRDQGTWRRGAVSRSRQCQAGRGHQDFSDQPCI